MDLERLIAPLPPSSQRSLSVNLAAHPTGLDEDCHPAGSVGKEPI